MRVTLILLACFAASAAQASTGEPVVYQSACEHVVYNPDGSVHRRPNGSEDRTNYTMAWDPNTNEFLVLTPYRIVHYQVRNATGMTYPQMTVRGVTPYNTLFVARFVAHNWLAAKGEDPPAENMESFNAQGGHSVDDCNLP